MPTPSTIFEEHLDTGERTMLKQDEVLGGYDNIDPADPGRQKLNGEQLQFLSLTQKGEEAAETTPIKIQKVTFWWIWEWWR